MSGATLRSIKGKIAEVVVYLGDPETPDALRTEDDYITVWYRQHAYTGAMEANAQKSEESGRSLEALVKMCVPVFDRWTLKLGGTDTQYERLDNAHASGDARAIERIEQEIADTVAEQEPLEITEANLLEYVPASVLMLILEAIGEARRPNPNVTGSQSRKR